MLALEFLDWLPPVLDRCRAAIADGVGGASWQKSSARDPSETVSDIDLAVEELLIDAIRDLTPDAGVVSEESFPDAAPISRPGPCFVIDPIDGTDELVKGQPGYAVSIALFHDGRPAAAALDLPAHDWRFTAVVGGGALLNGAPVALSSVQRLSDASLAVSATQRGAADLGAFWAGVGARALVPTPAFAAKFAAVLAGVCDAAFYLPVRPYPTALWDYAAAATILREAGGWYGSTQGDDLLARLSVLYRGGWIVSPPQLRADLLALANRAATSDRS